MFIVSDAETRRMVRAALARIARRHATVLVLRYSGLSYAEIATAMEISEPAARRNVHEGLKRLREERPR